MKKLLVAALIAGSMAFGVSSAFAVEPLTGPSDPPNCLGVDVSGLAGQYRAELGQEVKSLASHPTGGLDGRRGIGGELQMHRAGTEEGVSCN
jgi:hypothetical protein